jgi:hypothetical protein
MNKTDSSQKKYKWTISIWRHCLTFLAIKENENKNETEILFHMNQNNHHQKNKQQILARMWGKKDSYSLLVGV